MYTKVLFLITNQKENMMPEIDHDWDKIETYKHKYTLFDRIVLTFILVTIAICTTLMLLSLFNPRYFLCL